MTIQTSLQPRFTLPHERYAVVLNANAGRVTPRLRRSLEAVVPRERLFLTESPEHAREVLHRCLEDEVGTVFAGGGDGTIIDTINTLQAARGDAPVVPDVGILRLGTGNALARYVGSGRPLRTLKSWRDGRVHRVTPLQLVQAEGTVFPFAGLGYDAAILNDYIALRKASRDQWWAPLTLGVRGYLMATFLKTLPAWWRRPPARLRLVNLGGPAWRLDEQGRQVGEALGPGETLYEGPCTFVGAATMPLYGYGFRVYPHATRRAGRFQVRVYGGGATDCIRRLPELWSGDFTHPALHDFHAERVRLVFDQAMPYQLGGDPHGYRRELSLGLGEVPVNLVGEA